MRTTVTLNRELLEKARELTGTPEVSKVVNQALEALVAQESARRLALLGGSDPGATAAPRDRH